jgi:hypothetical protein
MLGPGYRALPAEMPAEDAIHRDSKHSLFVQLADVNAFLLYQMFSPSKYVQRQGARNYFKRLDPILCKVACRTHALGIKVI